MTLDRETYFFTPRYTRGQVCKVLSITKDTLRHYEKCGIVSPKENEHNRYKYYSIADLEILNVILFLRAIDVPIQDIPRFIECKDIDSYGELLSEQIDKVTLKINYWTHVRGILVYFQKALEDYKKTPHQVKLIENVSFRFCMTQFDYKNDDIEKMAPSKSSSMATYHVSKLKIVGKKWIASNREETADMIIGHLYDEEEVGDICTHTLPKSLMITTLETIDKLPEMIRTLWKTYEGTYEFEDRVYFIEHTFFNIFNQEKLLRNIYLPIVKVK